MGMSEGTVTKWYKKIGDEINEEEPIASAEAEKRKMIYYLQPLVNWLRSLSKGRDSPG